MPGKGMTFGDWISQVREEGLENASDRWYSVYPATVADDADEQQQGRTKIRVGVLGFTEPQPRFSYPVSPYAGENYGFYFPPHKDSGVWVTFDHGDTNSARVVGSWWQNPADDKKPGTSHVPAEFVKTDGTAPTARGIKIKKGHGLIFEGDESEPHVEMWTGKNKAAGERAEKHHRVRLDDTEGSEEIVIASFGGHKSTWRDKTGDVFVEHKTTDGHRILMDDTGKKILIETSGGHKFTMDDSGRSIEAETTGGHKVTMDDIGKKITVATTVGQTVEMDDALLKIDAQTSVGNQLTLDGTLQSNRMITPTGQIIEQGLAGTTMTDPGPVTVVAGGPLAMTGLGTAMTSSGGAPALQTATGVSTSTFTGLKTDNCNGGWIVAVVGLMQFTVGVFNVLSTQIGLGSGPQFRLVDERFFASYNAHFHTTTAPGAPTGPPIFGQGIPGNHTTVQTTAA